MSLRLSVLDRSVAVEGRGEDAALRDTLELAEHGRTIRRCGGVRTRCWPRSSDWLPTWRRGDDRH